MKYIEYAVSERIAFITLNRPEKSNALCHELVSELKQAFHDAEQDGDVKVVILKANGDAFCAGADLDYLQSLQNFSYEQNLADSNHLKELYLTIYQLKKVVISQVHAHALAGGCGLATVCDFSYASTEANFGYTEVKIGFVPAIVMVFLIRKVGETRAKQLLLGGAIISADEALMMGLINHVSEGSQLEEKVLEFARQLIENNSSSSMSITKQMFSKVQSLHIEDALTFASEANAKARASEDCKRGIAAFLNKERVSW
ncbi:MAG: enoyl-CoA hydratase/isomerase family protein [Cyclobacteriaceae bacterium]